MILVYLEMQTRAIMHLTQISPARLRRTSGFVSSSPTRGATDLRVDSIGRLSIQDFTQRPASPAMDSPLASRSLGNKKT